MSVVGLLNPKCMNESDRNRKRNRKRSNKPIEVTEKTDRLVKIRENSLKCTLRM